MGAKAPTTTRTQRADPYTRNLAKARHFAERVLQQARDARSSHEAASSQEVERLRDEAHAIASELLESARGEEHLAAEDHRKAQQELADTRLQPQFFRAG
jgi:spore cortex formation protein SpoVR/YcgB (stage V sporulation)